MLPRPSIHLAAYLVNAAHDQLAHARRMLSAALEERASEPGRKAGECGTPAGYRRHQRAEESACWACVEANNWDKRRRGRAA
jgi:hypothetical protein